MKRLLYATGNKYKIESMKERVKGTDIEIISPNDLNIKLNVVEDGKTVVENARKKAKAYYDATKIPTIAGDTALFIEKFEEQPGLYVHRVNGKELTIEETLEYYVQELKKVGGTSEAYYYTGLVMIKDDIEYNKEIKEEQKDLNINTKREKIDILAIRKYMLTNKEMKLFVMLNNVDIFIENDKAYVEVKTNLSEEILSNENIIKISNAIKSITGKEYIVEYISKK